LILTYNQHQQPSNNSSKYKKPEYKISSSSSSSCDGIGCINLAIHRVNILYLTKPGFFCDACTKYLQKAGVVISSKAIDSSFEKERFPEPNNEKM
jgi:hypothetical protein